MFNSIYKPRLNEHLLVFTLPSPAPLGHFFAKPLALLRAQAGEGRLEGVYGEADVKPRGLLPSPARGRGAGGEEVLP